MIKNIIFDFGDVFINLDKAATESKLYKLGVKQVTQELIHFAQLYEMGLFSTDQFTEKFLNLFPTISIEEFKNAWNSILLDTPKNRLDFIKELSASKKYRLFLLSNTNEMHISWIQNNWGLKTYNEFKDCFEQFYLSHEIQLRKPNFDIYEFVLEENNLKSEETFFIDDTQQNTDTAKELGIQVWNINPVKEDVVDLLSQKEFNP